MAQDLMQWLLGAAAKSTATLLMAGLGLALVRRASASLQHLAWSLAVGASLVLPLLTLALPAWRVEVLAPTGVPALQEGHAEPTAPVKRSWMPDEPTAPRVRLTLGDSAPRVQAAARSVPSPDGWTALAGAYLAGVLLVLGRALAARVGLWRLAREARPVLDAERLALLFELRVRLGMDRPVRLLESEQVELPLTFGAWRPAIVLPLEAAGWSRERLEPVLLHELAHAARFDVLTQLLAQLACAIYWFNPVVWLAARRMHTLREYACDDEVLSSGVRASSYAEQILAIAHLVRRPEPLLFATPGMAGHLRGRLVAILDPARARGSLGRRRLTLAAGLALALVLPLSMLRPAEAKPPLRASFLLAAADAGAPLLAPSNGPAAPAPTAPPRGPPSTHQAGPPPAEPSASDDELAGKLTRRAEEGGVQTEAQRQELLREVERIRDPRLRAGLLVTLLKEAETSVETGRAVLAAARKLGAERYTLEVLEMMNEIRESHLVRGPLAFEYLDACSQVRSDDGLADCLTWLLHPRKVEPAAVVRALSLAERLDSGRNRAKVLQEVTDHQALDDAVVAAYRKVLDGMDERSREEALKELEDAKGNRRGKQDRWSLRLPGFSDDFEPNEEQFRSLRPEDAARLRRDLQRGSTKMREQAQKLEAKAREGTGAERSGLESAAQQLREEANRLDREVKRLEAMDKPSNEHSL